MQAYLVVLAVAVVVSAAAVPPLRALSVRIGAMAEPGDRTVHEEATPVLGGTALYVGLLAGVGAARLLEEFDPLFDSPGNLLGVLAAATIMWFIG
ncbi:MAG: undecaprenyl/decaprenyl-phosphate alpha-N-acetylglucosaminyl 1-phosphate transferase, partial [Acidobacteria bacterium]|nr:undecaprenyl/decaprenyl-phosphate alpha-N-acetylglucosaminyl 1-phosphate transferase [Acidobacteriota bacterium]